MSPMQPHLTLIIFLIVFPCVSLARNSLSVGGTLFASQSLNYNAYLFVMQTDCNLVLYDNNVAIWASGTNGRGSNCRAVMQSDGNFVIYDGGNFPVWATNTDYGSNQYVLILQPDRNIVIYQGSIAIWATGTNVVGVGVTIVPRKDLKTKKP